MSQPIIVVSADGAPAAALRRASEVAAATDSRVLLVSAYERVPKSRLRAERRHCPEELQWRISPDGGC